MKSKVFFSPGDLLRVNYGEDRQVPFYQITGVHLGALNQEDVITCVSLNKEQPNPEMSIPISLVKACMEKTLFTHYKSNGVLP